MCPVIVYRDGEPYATLGLPGGQMIVSVTAQLVVSVLDFQATPEQAVNAPRVHVTGQEPVLASETTPTDVVQTLKREGNEVTTQRVGGYANVAILDPQKGVRAATDAGRESAIVL
jgi:gamma-glutamyltranspeptidase/glutathione hydrolase